MAKTEAQKASNRKYMAKSREANREKHRAKDRAWYYAHKERRLATNKAWREKNPEKHRATKIRQFMKARQDRTGFTQADWDERFIEQNGLCAICRIKGVRAADHNHQTGQKRALLCISCNVALGHIEGPLYQKFLQYLREWNGREKL